MSKINEFRKLMSEKGIELTPEEAENYYHKAQEFIKISKEMSMIEIMKFSEDQKHYDIIMKARKF